MADINNYYDRTESEIEKGYDRHLFRAGNVLQSAELNEIQGVARNRIKQLGDAMFKDGDIIRDARVVVNPTTGAVTAESGAVYIDGAVRGVPPASFTIPITGTVVIGIYLDTTVVTEADDPSLSEPAVETQAYGEPGAARLRIDPRWGVQGSDLQDFFPIYYVDSGQLRAKEAPPVMDSVNQAIARYDIDSTGSNYVVSGMRVTRLADRNGNQIYTVEEGRARVNGQGVVLGNSRRLTYSATPELKTITSEPFASQSATSQTVTLARPPAKQLTQVTITRERTVTVVHSSVSGTSDPLPDSSVVRITRVWQGGTDYNDPADYKLTGQTVDWSPTGAEPAPGSSYQVTYQFIDVVTPTNFNGKTFRVAGAVVGSLILTTYDTMLPRIDRLCIDDSGAFVWIKGIATDFNPVRPAVPTNLITLAQVQQNWDSTTAVINDGVRTVSMREIESMGRNIETLIDLVAQQFLVSDLSVRENGTKKGLFTDPFLNDDHRDAGVAQTGACVNGVLTLAITPSVRRPTSDIAAPQTCAYVIEEAISQTERTGSVKINPYMAFDVPSSPVVLNPSVDRWTETETDWLSDTTAQFIVDRSAASAWGWSLFRFPSFTTTGPTSDVLVNSTQSKIQYLRQIEINFTISGFGPGETLTTATFDGIAITPTAI